MSVLRTALSVTLVAHHDEVNIKIRNQVKCGSREVTVLAAERRLVLEICLNAFAATGTREKRPLVMASADALEALIASPARSRHARGSTREAEAVEAAETTSGDTTEAPSTLLVGTAAGRGAGTWAVVARGIDIPVGCSLLQPEGGREQDGFGKHYVTV